MKCPKWLLDAMAEGESVKCWVDENHTEMDLIYGFNCIYDFEDYLGTDESCYNYAEPYKEPYKELKHEFKPFEKTLMRNSIRESWECKIFNRQKGALFSDIDDKTYIECIPYKGNEKLLGTTDYPEEKQ